LQCASWNSDLEKIEMLVMKRQQVRGFISLYFFLLSSFLEMAMRYCGYISGSSGEKCSNESVLLEGKRQFCRRHHRATQMKDMSYAAEVLAYNTDPHLMATKIAYTTVYEEVKKILGNTDYYIATNPAVYSAQIRLEVAMRDARERLQPGIHAIEAAEDDEAEAEVEAYLDDMQKQADIKEAEEWTMKQERKHTGKKGKRRYY